jgi:hypothetical protein
MATLKGIAQNTIYPQPGFVPAQNQNGGWEGTHRFMLSRASLDNSAVRTRFGKGVSVVTLDPNVPSYFSFMTLDRIEGCEFGEGELVTLVCAFAGAEGATYGGGAGPLPTYELSCELQEAPFSQHSKWKALEDDEKNVLGYVLNGSYLYDLENEKVQVLQDDGERVNNDTLSDLLTADAKEFAKLIAQGETTYLRPVITWTERLEGNTGLSSNELNDIGKIATPRGNPPDATGSRDWQLTSAYQSETGSKYLTTLQWSLSEKEGHNSFLYE